MEVKEKLESLAKVRGEIAVAKMRLTQAEETERELLRKICCLCTEADKEGESLWEQQELPSGDFEMALVVGQDVAVVKIEEDYFERPILRRNEAVNVSFVPLIQQAL